MAKHTYIHNRIHTPRMTHMHVIQGQIVMRTLNATRLSCDLYRQIYHIWRTVRRIKKKHKHSHEHVIHVFTNERKSIAHRLRITIVHRVRD